jgi:acyl-CoA hydrolase
MSAISPVSPADAAALVRTKDTVSFGLGPAQPTAFLHALAGRDDWEDLVIGGALLVDWYEVMLKPGVTYRSGFYGPFDRALRDQGANVEFVPADFRRFAPVLREQCPRIMCTVAAPPDEDGFMSLSLHNGATEGEMHLAGRDPERLLIVEVNEHYPRTKGVPPTYRNAIHVDEADVIVQGDKPPLALPDSDPSDAERAIAAHAMRFVPSGATLQTGIGGIPAMVATLLAEGPGGDFGVHSEMFTTGLMKLHKAGKVTNANKGQYSGVSITTFAMGNEELYGWLDGNDEVAFLPVDVVNAPEVIARNKDMITINGALAVDLSGQVVADSIAGKQFSGIGGHEDFISGPGLDFSDRSLICLPSTFTKGGVAVSRIVAMFAEGTVVTTPRHQLDVVITEHGVAELRGRSVRERGLALAAIAEPAFREELRAAAEAWPLN